MALLRRARTKETLMKNTQLLLINDMCGYGKVALSAMLPVLSHMGYRIHNLPTALVSDTLNYPKFYIHDTTEYVRQSLAIWEELGFEFDAISTGFIVTEEETRIISDFCHRRGQRAPRCSSTPSWATTASSTPACPSPRLVSCAACSSAPTMRCQTTPGVPAHRCAHCRANHAR